MDHQLLAIAAIFLPIFPFSMIFSSIMGWVRYPVLRAVLLIGWPLMGLQALAHFEGTIPAWLVAGAMVSALFYAWRALALREAGQWICFVALSAWPLAWAGIATLDTAMLQLLGISAPLALMALVAGVIERRFGGVHVALDLRLASVAPRLAGLFVASVLAAIAMPLSPSFFALLALVTDQIQVSFPTVLAVLMVWLLWSWSGMRLVQGVVIGASRGSERSDISPVLTAIGLALITVLALAGVALGGMLL